MLILHEVNTMDKRLYKMMGVALAASLWLAPVSVQAAHIDFDRHSHESVSQTAVHHERQTTAKAQQTAKAVQAEPSWYWLGSDDKYSKYFDPASVVITASVATDRGKVPTEIKVWTKTTYSYGGAQETLEAYGLSSKFPDPNQLAYSTAQLVIKPQYRTIQYAAEHFYNKNGEIIWSKADPKAVEKEITTAPAKEKNSALDGYFSEPPSVACSKICGRPVLSTACVRNVRSNSLLTSSFSIRITRVPVASC